MENAEAYAAALAQVLGLAEPAEATVWGLMAVFARVGAVVTLLPGFGERTLPLRLKLGVAIAFTAVIWPLLAPAATAAGAALVAAGPAAQAGALLAETAVGLVIGLSVRLVYMALQIAGAIAAQATAVAQIAGAEVAPDPLPAIGAILTVGGVALAMALGLHVKAAAALAGSYGVLGFGVAPLAGDLAAWGSERVAAAFGLALALAAPFAAASLLYNLALGAINRAMPQLMVAFVGAPAITLGALILLGLLAPEMLGHWHDQLDRALADPFGTR